MVRKSKLPEITLHLDNKKETLSQIALSSNGTINIFPTSQGGIFPVKNLITSLNLIDYLYYNDKKLYMGNDIQLTLDDQLFETDTARDIVEEIHLNCNSKVIIGEDIEVTGGAVSEIEIEMIAGSIEIDGSGGTTSISGQEVYFDSKNLELFASDTISIGTDLSGNQVSENVNVFAQNIKIECKETEGSINVEAPLIYFEGMVKFNNTWTLNGSATFNDEIMVPKGIWFDERGDYSIYAASGEENALNLKVDVSGNGFVYESSSGEIMTLSPQGNLSVEGDLDCEGDLMVLKDISILGNIVSSNIDVDTSGNVVCRGTINIRDSLRQEGEDNVSNFNIDASGNMEVKNINVSENITSTGFLLSSGNISANNCKIVDEFDRTGVELDSSGNITCLGYVEAETYHGHFLEIDSSGDGSGTRIEHNKITTKNIVCLDANITDLKTTGVHIYGDQIECSGNIVAKTIDISDNCTADEVHVLNKFSCQNVTIENGEFTSSGICNFDTLHTNTIKTPNGLTFDSSGGGTITGNSLQVDGQIYTKELITETTVIKNQLVVETIVSSTILLSETTSTMDASGFARGYIEIILPILSSQETFGPEYTVNLSIFHDTAGQLRHQINLCFVVNFGSFFNDSSFVDSSGYNCTGFLGDAHFNGPDRIIFKHFDTNVWGNKVNEIFYKRKSNIIQVDLEYIGENYDTSFTYYFSKRFGLGLQ
jgi:hypothetical protein